MKERPHLLRGCRQGDEACVCRVIFRPVIFFFSVCACSVSTRPSTTTSTVLCGVPHKSQYCLGGVRGSCGIVCVCVRVRVHVCCVRMVQLVVGRENERVCVCVCVCGMASFNVSGVEGQVTDAGSLDKRQGDASKSACWWTFPVAHHVKNNAPHAHTHTHTRMKHLREEMWFTFANA
mgnify:CR=1 FL=1